MEVQVQERIVEVPHIQTIEKVVEAGMGKRPEGTSQTSSLIFAGKDKDETWHLM